MHAELLIQFPLKRITKTWGVLAHTVPHDCYMPGLIPLLHVILSQSDFGFVGFVEAVVIGL